MELTVNYPEVGATADEELPAGYRHIDRDVMVDAPLSETAEFLMTWGLHEACSLRPQSAAPRVATGAEVQLRFAGIAVPCKVVWVVEEADRVGFAYGSLPGHPELGEASFMLEAAGMGRTRFTMRSFSKPGSWYVRLTAPISRKLQDRAVDRFLRTMRAVASTH